MATRLSLSTLGQLGPAVGIPGYRRDELSPGIVHIGVGNFHRAHQAAYLDELFERGLDRDWAIIGTGVRASDAEMGRDLAAQDFLTTVVTQEAGRSQARVTGAIIDFVAPGETAAILERLVDPRTRIVSLTVTEGGYYIDPATQAFDPGHPDIVADAADRLAAPKTAFGLIAAGLLRRRAAGLPPFTVMSCDNLPGNGHVTADAVAGLVELIDRDDANWIRDSVAFPNGMVDRITPATSERERQSLREDFGIADSRPVFCEGFRQWVLEDHFPAGRPRLEEVGVQFVADVAPFELMKIRILNGGHAAIAYPGALLDIHFVHETMEDPDISGFLAKLEKTEIIPCVPPVPNTDIQDYFKLIERRFANPKIGDTVARLAQDGSTRQPTFILPSTSDRLAKGEDVQGLALVSALWCRYFEGKSDSGKTIEFNDASAERLQKAALASRDNPLAFLELKDIFGEVGESKQFQKRFTEALASLRKNGTPATLKAYIDGSLGD